jgi:hypothetical protein
VKNSLKITLKHVDFDEGLLMKAKNWIAGSGKSFILKKEQIIYIPQSAYNEIRVG